MQLRAFVLCSKPAIAIRMDTVSTLHSENLFRRQAIQSLSKKTHGRPIAIMPRPWLWLTSLTVTIFLAAGVFVSTAEYSRKETVRGWLVSRGGVVRITHHLPAMVDEVAINPGDSVRSGDPVIYVSQETMLENGVGKSEQALIQLRTAVAELDVRQQLLREQLDIGKSSIAAQLHDIDAEAQALLQQTGVQQHRVELAADKAARLREASRDGVIAHWDTLRQDDELSALRQQLSQLQQNTMALDRERERLRSQAARLPLDTEASISALRSQRTLLLRQITDHESQRVTVLRSPIDGVVAAVEIHAGNAVVPQQLLATILPHDLELAAVAYLPSRAIGFIQPGQAVRLMYDAFPQQKFGAFAGRVERVSAFVLLPADIPQTFAVREATYKIVIAIDHQAVAIGDAWVPLRPGMLLAAEIVLERRSFVDWLLEPLRRRRAVT